MDTNLNKKVLDLIHSSIISESGDGDAIWLSKHTSLIEIKKLIDEYNTSNNTGWKVEEKIDRVIQDEKIGSLINYFIEIEK